MVRGKKNYLPACQLQMGFGLMFKLDDDSVERHREDRKVGIYSAEGDEQLASTDDLKDDESLVGSDDNEGDGASSADEFPDVQVDVSI